MKSSFETASSQKKRETHAVFDTLWSFLPVTREERAQYRSTLYRVWGAVLAGELGDVGGVRNPSEGGQHIRSMTSLHQEKCQEFIHHLVRSHRGRISSIAANLSKWSSGFNSDYQTDAVIQQSLNENVFIRTIRQTLGISAYTQERPKAIKAKRPDSVFSVLSEEEPEIIEDNSATISTSTDSFTPSSSVATTKPKRKHLTAAQHFTEGMIAGIEGNINAMLIHFDNRQAKIMQKPRGICGCT